MIRAHELIANLIPDSDEFKNCMSAVKFDLGELNDVYDLSDLSTGTVFEIPAPICLFQTTNMTDTNLFLAVQDCGGVVWKCFHKNINDPVVLFDEWPIPEEKRYTWRISCGKCSYLVEGYGKNPNHLIDHWNSRMRDE